MTGVIIDCENASIDFVFVLIAFPYRSMRLLY